MPTIKHQNGITLTEIIIALGLITVVIGATVALYDGDKQEAQDVIAQLQMAKAGVLRYNLDNPRSTDKLSRLIDPAGATHNWNGPYVDMSVQLAGDNLDISNVYPDTQLQLVHETIDGNHYQAVIVKGAAETGLRSAILAKCGNDCTPLPGQDDIGLLIQQVAAVAPYGVNGFNKVAIASTLPPVLPISPEWQPPASSLPAVGNNPPTLPALPPAPAPVPTPTPAPSPVSYPAATPPTPVPSTPLPYTVPPLPEPTPSLPENPPIKIELRTLKMALCEDYDIRPSFCDATDNYVGHQRLYDTLIRFVPLSTDKEVTQFTLGHLRVWLYPPDGGDKFEYTVKSQDIGSIFKFDFDSGIYTKHISLDDDLVVVNHTTWEKMLKITLLKPHAH